MTDIAEVNTSDTFENWRRRTNQVIDTLNESTTRLNTIENSLIEILSKIGPLDQLATNAKTNLVQAINELKG